MDNLEIKILKNDNDIDIYFLKRDGERLQIAKTTIEWIPMSTELVAAMRIENIDKCLIDNWADKCTNAT